MIFFQYCHIGDITDQYRCRQADSSIADTKTSIGIVANPGPSQQLTYTSSHSILTLRIILLVLMIHSVMFRFEKNEMRFFFQL